MRGSEETVLNKLDAVRTISSRIEDRTNTLVYMVSQENRAVGNNAGVNDTSVINTRSHPQKNDDDIQMLGDANSVNES